MSRTCADPGGGANRGRKHDWYLPYRAHRALQSPQRERLLGREHFRLACLPFRTTCHGVGPKSNVGGAGDSRSGGSRVRFSASAGLHHLRPHRYQPRALQQRGSVRSQLPAFVLRFLATPATLVVMPIRSNREQVALVWDASPRSSVAMTGKKGDFVTRVALAGILASLPPYPGPFT